MSVIELFQDFLQGCAKVPVIGKFLPILILIAGLTPLAATVLNALTHIFKVLGPGFEAVA